MDGTTSKHLCSGYLHPMDSDPKKHISISILKGYPYLTGLHYKGIKMGYPYPMFLLLCFLGPEWSQEDPGSLG